MKYQLGVFDLLANSIPGTALLAVATYWLVRFEWVEVPAIDAVTAILALPVGLGASLMVGHLLYPLGNSLNSLINSHDDATFRAEQRRDFKNLNGSESDRPYVDSDHRLLLGAVELQNPDAAATVYRLIATGIMVRSSTIPLALAAATAAGELIYSDQRLFALCALLSLAGGAAIAVLHADTYTRWAIEKTLELAAWIPDIDDHFAPKKPNSP